jgi:hypothetical protein
MSSEAGAGPGRRPVVPSVNLHRCPACGQPSVPILSDPAESEFWAICLTCSFEGRFPPGTRAAARARTWIANETRRRRFRSSGEYPQPRLSRAEYVAEVGGPSGGG